MRGSLRSLSSPGTRGVGALTVRGWGSSPSPRRSPWPPSSCRPASRLCSETLAVCPCPFSFPLPARPLATSLLSDRVSPSSPVTSALHSILGEEARGGGRGPRWGGGPRLRQPPAPESSVPGAGGEPNMAAGGRPWQELARYPAGARAVPALSRHALGPDRRADEGAGHPAHPLQPDSGGAAGRHPRPGRRGPAKGAPPGAGGRG